MIASVVHTADEANHEFLSNWLKRATRPPQLAALAIRSTAGLVQPIPYFVVEFLGLVIGFPPSGLAIATVECEGIYRPDGADQDGQNKKTAPHQNDLSSLTRLAPTFLHTINCSQQVAAPSSLIAM